MPISSQPASPPRRQHRWSSLKQSIVANIKTDYAHFYTKKHLLSYGAALGIAAVLANSKLFRHSGDGKGDTADEAMQALYKACIRNDALDTVLENGKRMGEGRPLALIGLVSAGTGLLVHTPLANWGARVSRGYLLGALVMMVGQRVIGASRPIKSTPEKGSRWQLFSDRNGISGHAFAGAVPMLTLAAMINHETDVFVMPLKRVAFLASALPAYSRFNDDSHYISQVVLGWYLAKLSVDAVQTSETQRLQKHP